MTDIIKSFKEKISTNLLKYLRENPEFEKKNILSFKQELGFIGASNPILIAMGNDSHRILKKHLKNEFKILKVTHYSHRGINKEELREEFQALIADMIFG